MLETTTRRTFLAALPALTPSAASAPSIAAASDTEPSNPVLASAIRDLMATLRARYASGSDIAAMLAICDGEARLTSLAEQLWTGPPRGLGDLALRAELVAYWDDPVRRTHRIVAHTHDGARASAELVKAVGQLAQQP